MTLPTNFGYIRLYCPSIALINITNGAADKTLGTLTIPDLKTLGGYVAYAYLGFTVSRIVNNNAGANKTNGAQHITAYDGVTGSDGGIIPDSSLALDSSTGISRFDYTWRGELDVSGKINNYTGTSTVTIVWAQSLSTASSIDLKDVQAFVDCYLI